MITNFPRHELPNVLKILAHEVRWQLLSLLAYSDYRVNELSTLLHRPINLISYHLRLLRSGSIVQEHRSSADARDVYYSLDLEHFESVYTLALESLHPGLSHAQLENTARLSAEGHPPIRVLFLCTHNSARSQMAEALLRHIGGGRVEVYSAGTEATVVRPEALAVLHKNNIDSTGLYSKHLTLFLGQDFDYVITVCDNANETCPIFPGIPERIHWSLPDPSAITDVDKRYIAFAEVFAALEKRIQLLVALINRPQSEA